MEWFGNSSGDIQVLKCTEQGSYQYYYSQGGEGVGTV